MRRAAAAVALLLALSGCSSDDDPAPPVFGGGDAPSTSPDDPALVAAKVDAGVEDCPTSDGTPPSRDALPDVTLACLGGGRPVTLSGLTGTPTVINLWASWCVPCRKELPHLARADEEYGDALRVVGIDYADPAPDAALELAARSGVTFPLLVDRDEATVSSLKVVGLPQTVFVDAQGRMVATERTWFRSYADLTAAIEEHLGVTP